MKARWISLMVLITAAVAFADKKSDGKYSPGPASSYSTKQTNDKVTIAVTAYDTEELAHTAFGKLNPNEYGVLPVLVIIQNDTDQALKFDHLEVDYTGTDGRHVEATPASDIQVLGGAPRPKMPGGAGTPLPLPRRKYKNPLNTVEIESRAFSVKILPPHESANGFFYFQTEHRPGAKFFLTGIKEAATGKDITFFEIPIDYHR
jgi:hypothetical protein